MIGEEAVGLTVLDQVIGDVDSSSVDEAADDLAVAVQFGGGLQGALVEETLGKDTIDLFADSAVLAVDQIIEGGAAG